MNIVKCKIAGLNVVFKTDIPCLHKIMREYVCDFNTPDITLSITDEQVRYEEDVYEGDSNGKYQTTFKIAAFFRKLGAQLPSHNSFVLHSACFDADGVGVAFAAHSGTGKTTHMGLWQELLGEKMVVVNGDKPIVRFFDDEPEQPYAYGTPWNGKEKLGCNMRTPLKHICFIERSETNFVEKISKEDALPRILKQIYMPRDAAAVMKTMKLTDRLLSSCDLWIIHCNMDVSAAETSYKEIFKK